MRLKRDLAKGHDLSSAGLRVLSIAHSAVTRAIGRIRYEAMLAECPDLGLTLVAPDRWQEYGRIADARAAPHGLEIRLEPIRLPRVPKAGWVLALLPAPAVLAAGAQARCDPSVGGALERGRPAGGAPAGPSPAGDGPGAGNRPEHPAPDAAALRAVSGHGRQAGPTS